MMSRENLKFSGDNSDPYHFDESHVVASVDDFWTCNLKEHEKSLST